MAISNQATVTIHVLPERPYVVGQYLRAYFGADTPLSVYVRGEEGPLDLSCPDDTEPPP